MSIIVNYTVNGGGHGNPLQYSRLETEETGGYNPWVAEGSDTTEAT